MSSPFHCDIRLENEESQTIEMNLAVLYSKSDAPRMISMAVRLIYCANQCERESRIIFLMTMMSSTAMIVVVGANVQAAAMGHRRTGSIEKDVTAA